MSPWSSDSKEFGNGSPPEWTTVRQGWDRPKQEQEEWWDAAEDIVDDSVQGKLNLKTYPYINLKIVSSLYFFLNTFQ